MGYSLENWSAEAAAAVRNETDPDKIAHYVRTCSWSAIVENRNLTESQIRFFWDQNHNQGYQLAVLPNCPKDIILEGYLYFKESVYTEPAEVEQLRKEIIAVHQYDPEPIGLST
jgi:hypothetical protein